MIKTICILLILICPAMATSIDIYYPNNNTTTDIYYSTGSNNYTYITTNSISGELTSIILKDTIEYDNIIESPHKAVQPLFKIILFVVLLCVGIIILIALKKVF